jgi:hypothetical protein
MLEALTGNERNSSMNKLLITTPIVASILLSTAALATGTTAVGTVKSVDTNGDSITLNDGGVYILSEGFEAESFKPGQKVAISFKMKGGKMIATSVKMAK